MSERFSYIKYDDKAVEHQATCLALCEALEVAIQSIAKDDEDMSMAIYRCKALALTKLEECYAWIGKAVRDDQVFRSGSKTKEPGESK